MRKLSLSKEHCKYTAKERLLAAGERLFTSERRATLTSRQIAEEAQVNHALIAYYYGTVSNLMEEVVRRCLEKLSYRLMPEVVQFSQNISTAPSQSLTDVFAQGLRDILLVLQGAESVSLLQALSAPESRYVEDVYTRFTEVITAPLFKCFLLFLTRYREMDPRSLEAAVLAQMMVAHTMAFFRGAVLVRRHVNCTVLSASQIQQANEVIVRTALALAAG